MGRRKKFLSKKINTTKNQYIEGAVCFLKNGGKLNSPDIITCICDEANLSTSNFYKLYSRAKNSEGKGSVLINFLEDYVECERELCEAFLDKFLDTELDIFEKSELLKEFVEYLEKYNNAYILDKLIGKYELFAIFLDTFFVVMGFSHIEKENPSDMIVRNPIKQNLFVRCLNCFVDDYSKESLDSLFAFIDKNLER